MCQDCGCDARTTTLDLAELSHRAAHAAGIAHTHEDEHVHDPRHEHHEHGDARDGGPAPDRET